MKINKILFTITLLAGALSAQAQSADSAATKYDQHKIFTPLFYQQNGNQFRTAGGAPTANTGKIGPTIN